MPTSSVRERGEVRQERAYRRKQRGKPRCNRSSRSPDQVRAQRVVSAGHYARGRTGSSPAHPFGSLATSGTSTSLVGLNTGGPSLCAPASRRVCPFEDERRCDPGSTPRLAPETVTKSDGLVRHSTVGRTGAPCKP